MQNGYNMCMTILLLIVGFVRAEHLLFSDCGIRTSRRQPRSSTGWSNHYNRPEPSRANAQQSASHRPEDLDVGSETTDSPNRNPKIMHGVPTLEGQYPWQVSLELMHPSYGFIGHWCGGVLIDRNWVLSAAHCIHNDLFNLPLPALWTVVLGEYDRGHESGYEQRIPVDKIILHEKYHNFKHDLVLLKLNRPANMAPNSRVKKICLPFADIKVNSVAYDPRPELDRLNTKATGGALFFYDYLGRPPENDAEQFDANHQGESGSDTGSESFPEPLPERDDNYLRRLRLLGESPEWPQRTTARVLVTRLVRQQLQRNGTLTSSRRSSRRGRRLHFDDDDDDDNNSRDYNFSGGNRRSGGKQRRRNDKFVHGGFYRNDHYRNEFGEEDDSNSSGGDVVSAIPDTTQYVDCLATGWGKSTIDDELTDILLQTKAPIQNSKKCEEAYGDFIKLHRGHLCAGNVDGTGGTCVGDSGGPLQCRITKHGPWILVGITSFGSGCAFKNYPDVYTKISFYRQWIMDTIRQN
ncbi:plasma kallikrein [Wyeomyia smithii]|uniref:plasma kallikrein n=1 Tax=Wyeomyia smithii TaxID=174621 RepID=UPI00246809CC|nr:plasma kallikrein [Wyeomyia smithii]